jgi:hypothetical protein
LLVAGEEYGSTGLCVVDILATQREHSSSGNYLLSTSSVGFNWTFYDHVINLDVDERCISREKSRNVGTGCILKFIAKGRRRGGKKKIEKKAVCCAIDPAW